MKTEKLQQQKSNIIKNIKIKQKAYTKTWGPFCVEQLVLNTGPSLECN